MHSRSAGTALSVFALLAGVLAAVSLACAQTAANSFNAKRYPFLPKLVEDANPPLCKIALADARERFLRTTRDTAVEEVDRNAITWLNWKDAPEFSAPGATVQRLDLDLDRSGGQQVVLYYAFPHSWRGDNFYAFVARSPQALKSSIAESGGIFKLLTGLMDSHLGRSIPTDPRSEAKPPPVVRYYPDAVTSDSPSEATTGSNWQEHRLFRWRGFHYFYAQGNEWGRMSGPVLDLYRLRSDGKVTRQCRLQVLPDDAAADLKFRKVPGIDSFLRVLSTIGAGGIDCGTLPSGHIHDGEASAAVLRAALRPWAVSRANRPYYLYDDRLVRFVEDWSFDEIWNRREYQTFLEHVEPAKRALRQYFREVFGLSAEGARREGQRVFEELMAARFLIPQDYQPENRNPGLTYGLLKYDPNHVQAAISALKAPPAPGQIPRVLSDFLHDAVEWPAGLQILLDAGADPQRRRDGELGFGKTALMTAAHMNRPDAVKILLKRGADPNSRTNSGTQVCGWTRIERGNRSALMYAAENAGPEVIALLLDAGADPSAKDSQGNGIGFYLALNPRFSDAERQMDARSLVKLRRDKSKGPGFDCSKASISLEKRICADEVLSMLDGEMGEAFQRWQRAGAGEDGRTEQTRWLRGRAESCMAGNEQAQLGCLQQLTRARARYLHNRLAEASSK